MTICPNLTDDQVKIAFSKFDTSGDDKLDYREFCEMIKQKVDTEYIDKVDISQPQLEYNQNLYESHQLNLFLGRTFNVKLNSFILVIAVNQQVPSFLCIKFKL